MFFVTKLIKNLENVLEQCLVIGNVHFVFRKDGLIFRPVVLL